MNKHRQTIICLIILIGFIILGLNSCKYRTHYYRTDYEPLVDSLITQADSINFLFRLSEKNEDYNWIYKTYMLKDSLQIKTFLSSIPSKNISDICVCLPDGKIEFYSQGSIINKGSFWFAGDILIEPVEYDSTQKAKYYVVEMSDDLEIKLRDLETYAR